MTARESYLLGLLNELGYSPDDITSDGAFDDRLRVQKATFLLNNIGIQPFTFYQFSLYLRGPYSRQLAFDYYNLEGVSPEPLTLDSEHLFLLRWFMGHDNRWLEIASSLLSIKKKYPQKEGKEIHSILRMSKPWVDDRQFESVFSELDSKGL